MAAKDWPSWRYGPSGEGQIFQREADVPKGWVDSPSKLPPAPEKLGGTSDTAVLEEERDALNAEIEKLRDENESLRTDNAALVEAYEARQRELEGEVSQFKQKLREVTETLARKEVELSDLQRLRGGRQSPASEQPQSARRPRKLNVATGTPFTAQDETVTLDEGRTERLKVLRDAGVTIADDATDGDIEEALDWLEQQGKKG